MSDGIATTAPLTDITLPPLDEARQALGHAPPGEPANRHHRAIDSSTEWRAVSAVVGAYLTRLGVTDAAVRAAVSTDVLTRLPRQGDSDERASLPRLAATEVIDLIDRRLAASLGRDPNGDRRTLAGARAAYLWHDGPKRQPRLLLGREAADGVADSGMSDSLYQLPPATPNERPGRMIEQCLDSWSLKGWFRDLLPRRRARPAVAGETAQS